MLRQKRYTDEEFIAAVGTSDSVRQVAIKLGLKPDGGGTYYSIYKTIKRLEVSTSHFTGSGWLKGKSHDFNTRPLEDFLKDNTNTVSVKRRLIKEGLLKEECYVCGLGIAWNDKPLVLQLDHIDGNRPNNDPSNLRLLCPNCHSQTSTFCGKGKAPANIKKYCECGTQISKGAKRCTKCAPKHRGKKS